MYVRFVEIDVFADSDKPVKGGQKENIPWIVSGFFKKLCSEFLVLFVLEHISRRKILPVRLLRHKNVI